jgi:DNA-binding NtrC family response regulator
MKLGALDYLQKPFEIDEFLMVVGRAIEHGRLRTHHDYLITERDEQYDHYGIVGRSRAIQEVVRTARLVAQSRSTVLITGETGTGKELVARAIHDWSAQREMPLVRVNCAALPETLIESELFGHVRGAFTGAVANKKGRFALADGGSILLDEIGVIAPSAQAKLLRVLQEREFEPLGSERTLVVDVRVIAATNRDLRQLVADGRFQEDLFYRLNVIPIAMPSLSDRQGGHSAARRALHPPSRRPRRQADRRHQPGGHGGARGGTVAGQRPRAREHARACGRADAAAGHPGARGRPLGRARLGPGRPARPQPQAESRMDRT